MGKPYMKVRDRLILLIQNATRKLLVLEEGQFFDPRVDQLHGLNPYRWSFPNPEFFDGFPKAPISKWDTGSCETVVEAIESGWITVISLPSTKPVETNNENYSMPQDSTSRTAIVQDNCPNLSSDEDLDMHQISQIIQKRAERKVAHQLEAHKLELQQQRDRSQHRETELTDQISCLEEKLKLVSERSNPVVDTALKVELENYRGQHAEIRNLMVKEIGILTVQLNESQAERKIDQEIAANLKGKVDRLSDELQTAKTGNATTDEELQAVKAENARLIERLEAANHENSQPRSKRLTYQYALTRLDITTLSTQASFTTAIRSQSSLANKCKGPSSLNTIIKTWGQDCRALFFPPFLPDGRTYHRNTIPCLAKMSKFQPNGRRAMQLLQNEIDTRNVGNYTEERDCSLIHSDVENALRLLKTARAIQSRVSPSPQGSKSSQPIKNLHVLTWQVVQTPNKSPRACSPIDRNQEIDIDVSFSLSAPNQDNREAEIREATEEEEDIYNATPEAALNRNSQALMHSNYNSGLVSGRTFPTAEKRNHSVLSSGGDKKRRIREL